MGSLTIVLIALGWGLTTLLVLRLFAAASRNDEEDEESRPRPHERRFEPQVDESPRDVAAAGRRR
jgi:hypothetical protein